MRKNLLAPFFVLLALTASGAEKIPGQKPLLLIGDKFQFISGSWATYQIQDKAKNESCWMYISVLKLPAIKLGLGGVPIAA